MRYAKQLWQLCLIGAVLSATDGCASIRARVQGARADSSAPVVASAPVATPLGTSPAPSPGVIVSPALLQAFDEANRAFKAGRMDEAERGYRAITLSNPQLGGPHANLGVIYRDAHQLPAALAEFKEAVRLNPAQPVYLNQLGVAYRQLGQFDKAREAYEQAIAHDANYAAAILNLGILMDMYLAEPGRALVLYQRSLALTPGGDATVGKWIAELKNRKPAVVPPTMPAGAPVSTKGKP